MNKLKIGVVGAGMIGQMHIRIHAENPNVTLAAIADIDEALGSGMAKEFGCKSYVSYKDMIAAEGLDLIDICLPEGSHKGPAIAATQAGLKGIMMEKPIAVTSRIAREIIAACEQSGTRLMVGHVLRFDPRYVQLGDAIEKGELGEVCSLVLRRTTPSPMAERLGGKVSIFYYLGVHDIEYMIDYAGAKPIKVYAQSTNRKNAQHDALDTVFAIVTFDSGVIGSLELSWGLPENAPSVLNTGVEVIGTKGMGVVNVAGEELKIISELGPVYSPDTLHWPTYNGATEGDLKRELHHFVDATASGDEYLVDTERATLAIEVIEACFKSLKSGQAETV